MATAYPSARQLFTLSENHNCCQHSLHNTLCYNYCEGANRGFFHRHISQPIRCWPVETPWGLRLVFCLTAQRRSHLSREENKVRFWRFADEAWNKGNISAVYETFADDYHAHAQDDAHDVHGPDGHAEFIRSFRASFPDVHVGLQHILAENDLVVAHMTWTGTHTGEPYMDIEPTGKKVAVSVTGINRFVGPKIVEAWGVVDTLGMLQQLGLIPSE